MKKIAALFLILLVLIGCSKKTPDISGTYELTGMVYDGQESTKEDMDALKKYGLNVTLTVNQDKTAKLVLFDEIMEMTYDAEKMVFVSEGEEIPFRYKKKDKQIIIEEEGTSLIFGLTED